MTLDPAAALTRLRYIEDMIRKEDAENSLFEFIKLMWPVVEPTREFVPGWHAKAVCDHLEAVERGEINRLLINIPPGFLKSLTVCVFFPAWIWGPRRKPDKRFLAFSYSEDLTVRDNVRFRRVIESPIYQRLWGDVFSPTRDQWGKELLQNDKTGFKLATSVGGLGTGARADFLLVDDPLNVTEGESEAVRKSTLVWFTESLPTRVNDPEDSAIILIMQRLHEEDPSGYILEHRLPYVHLCLPLEYEPQLHCSTEIGFEDPRRFDVNTGEELPDDLCRGILLDPIRYPPREVEKLKVVLGQFGTAGQLQQQPVPRGGGIIKVEWWKGYPLEGDKFDKEGKPLPFPYPPMEYILASLDTAYTTKQENDWSALTVWGVWRDEKDLSRIMLMAAWQEHLAFKPLIDKVMDTCRKHNVDALLIEAKASGISVAQEVGRLCNSGEWTVLPVNPKGDKVARVYSVQPLFEGGVIYAPDRSWSRLVIDQFSFFPKGRHDDLVDASTQALIYLRRLGLALYSDESAELNAAEDMYQSPSEPLYDV